MLDKVFENKNPGNRAKKKMVTLGFNTFIVNPILNNCRSVFFWMLLLLTTISELLLKTLYAKYNRYTAPAILIPKKMLSFSLITTETPKATNVVCTIQPVIKPTTVAKPYFFPQTTLCIKTKILSGPGEMASKATVDINVKRISVFNLLPYQKPSKKIKL